MGGDDEDEGLIDDLVLAEWLPSDDDPALSGTSCVHPGLAVAEDSEEAMLAEDAPGQEMLLFGENPGLGVEPDLGRDWNLPDGEGESPANQDELAKAVAKIPEPTRELLEREFRIQFTHVVHLREPLSK